MHCNEALSAVYSSQGEHMHDQSTAVTMINIRVCCQTYMSFIASQDVRCLNESNVTLFTAGIKNLMYTCLNMLFPSIKLANLVNNENFKNNCETLVVHGAFQSHKFMV